MSQTAFDISFLLNFGIAGFMLAYFIWRDKSYMEKFIETLEALKDAVKGCPARGVAVGS